MHVKLYNHNTLNYTYNALSQSAQKTYTALLTAGKKYRVSFDFGIDGITTASFTLSNGSTQVRDKLTTITTKEITEFTATATNLTLLATLSAGNYGRLAHIDNLEIAEIAEVGESYRFGFNGKENDNEVNGDGNWQDYGMRMYSPRLGRFPNVDPLTKDYPFLSTYQYAANCPIKFIDIDGLEAGEPGNNSFKAGLGLQNSEALKAEIQASSSNRTNTYKTPAQQQASAGAKNITMGAVLVVAGGAATIYSGGAAAVVGVITFQSGLLQIGVGMAQISDASVNANNLKLNSDAGGPLEFVGEQKGRQLGNEAKGQLIGGSLDLVLALGGSAALAKAPIVTGYQQAITAYKAGNLREAALGAADAYGDFEMFKQTVELSAAAVTLPKAQPKPSTQQNSATINISAAKSIGSPIGQKKNNTNALKKHF